MEQKPVVWTDIISLLVTYGPELIIYIFKKIKANGPVTPVEIDELLVLISKPGSEFFKK